MSFSFPSSALPAASSCAFDVVPRSDIDSSIKAICLNGIEVELMY